MNYLKRLLKERMKIPLFPAVLLCSSFSTVLGQLLPEPTGEYVPGVFDFEFLDTKYPSSRGADSEGRRIMVRVWYPACPRVEFDPKSRSCGTIQFGELRPYFEEGEEEAIAKPQADAFSSFFSQEVIAEYFRSALTFSYSNATLADTLSNLPVIVFSHGGMGTVSSHTALMEEFASHGFAVFSVTHPGGTSGILYPNGDRVRYDDDYLAEVFSGLTAPTNLTSPDIAIRYNERKKLLEENRELVRFSPRWRDDMIALVDFLEDETEGLLFDIVGGSVAGLIYGGYSVGASAAGSAAHMDSRARAAFNLDGTHQSLDLFDAAIRVPYIALSTENVAISGYRSEFFFEPLESMGSSPTVTRVNVFNATHFEFADVMFTPSMARLTVGGGMFEDGEQLHNTIVDFLLTFVDHFGGEEEEGKKDWSLILSTTLDAHPEVGMIDVSYVRDWALMQNQDLGSDQNQPTESTKDETPLSSAPGNVDNFLTILSGGLAFLILLTI